MPSSPTTAKLLVLDGEVDQDAVALGGPVHAECAEHLPGPRERRRSAPEQQRRGTRRSRCTRISADVRASAALDRLSDRIEIGRAQESPRPPRMTCAITSSRSRRRRRSCRRPRRTATAGPPPPHAAAAPTAPEPATTTDERPAAAAGGVAGAGARRPRPSASCSDERHDDAEEQHVESRARSRDAPSRALGPALQLGGRRAAARSARRPRSPRPRAPPRSAARGSAARSRSRMIWPATASGIIGLEPVADLEPQLAVLRRTDEQDHAVVEALLADAPLLDEADRDSPPGSRPRAT